MRIVETRRPARTYFSRDTILLALRAYIGHLTSSLLDPRDCSLLLARVKQNGRQLAFQLLDESLDGCYTFVKLRFLTGIGGIHVESFFSAWNPSRLSAGPDASSSISQIPPAEL